MKKNDIVALIWDYDGTLVDTQSKNLIVARKIIERFSGKSYDTFPVLRSLDAFNAANTRSENWRELYKVEFGFSYELTDEAGRYWAAFQANDDTPADLFSGITQVIRSMSHLPQGVVSQNSAESISATLTDNSIVEHFSAVIGYEEIDIDRPKPKPDGLLKCLNLLVDGEAGYAFYVGDHETDAQTVHNANKILASQESNLELVSIGALYGNGCDTSKWKAKPHYEAREVGDIISIIESFIV